MELKVQWQEPDLGEYPTIVLTWEDAMRAASWEYMEGANSIAIRYPSGAL